MLSAALVAYENLSIHIKPEEIKDVDYIRIFNSARNAYDSDLVDLFWSTLLHFRHLLEK